jgi:hypothetical protein
MSFLGGILMILAGLAILSFGLFLFYAFLPLLYGLLGLEIGLLLGRWLTGSVGATAIILGIGGAILLGLLSYALEPYRRILLGISGGVLIGLSIAALFGLDGWVGGFFGLILAAVCGIIGGIVVPYFFDAFIVAASAVAGAFTVMAGAHLILPNVALFDHAGGGMMPRVLALILAVVGIGWQFSKIEKWVQPEAGEVARRRAT